MARMIRAGRYNKVITLQVQKQIPTDYGGFNLKWVDFKTIRASIEPLQGREFFSAAQQQNETQLRIRIHYIPDVLPTMRIKYGDRLFAIVAAIDSKESHRELQLLCKEGVTDGR
ncbi:phage head closure protein [Pasteurella multocida]|uniref:phage head closure protein n=1 Tax=Pasteurella multocida TaxID=747 RepID=UPI00061A5F77|nr:phage head closure protein [Pasteurella multocida]AKD39458.1 phage head-tail adaptor [Pasteurella multocida OH1905]URJ90358.1 phage head closure protein [Pasteurella multocida]WRK05754.1 phage head closure protein [Pasteurella multocida]HDR1788451.1 phage head closure protein [Pasteurella multocida]